MVRLSPSQLKAPDKHQDPSQGAATFDPSTASYRISPGAASSSGRYPVLKPPYLTTEAQSHLTVVLC
jgi:hypothetical protein